MSTLVVKNLPDALHEALRRSADRHHRSINKETISLIEASIGPAAPRPSSRVAARVSGATGLTDDEFEQALTDETYARDLSIEDMERYMDELRSDRAEVRP